MPRAYRTDDDHTTDDEPCYNCGGSGDGGFPVHVLPSGKVVSLCACPRTARSGVEPKADD